MASAISPQSTVAIVGAGTMGAGIAQVAAAAGHPVLLYDVRSDAVQKAIVDIRNNLQKLVAKGKLNAHAAAQARISAALSIEELAPAKLVIEAVIEDLAAKRELFAKLENIVATDCILASNTSSLSITAIAAGLKNPAHLAGMHFFNPAPLMELVEVVSGLATAPDCAESIFATSAAWGKTPVHVKSSPGFIVNRVARPFYLEALKMLQERVASPATIDAVLRESGGFRMGPFELMDLIGNDVNFAVTKSVYEGFFFDERFRPSILQRELVDAGWFGRKTGRGWYDYSGNAQPPLPGTEPIIDLSLDASGVRDALADAGRCKNLLVTVPNYKRAQTAVVVDLALDYRTARRVAVMQRCGDDTYREAVALLQATGFSVTPVRKMIVYRTVLALAVEARRTVEEGVCTEEALNIAMRKGVNYPRGPLEWNIGVQT